MVWLFPRGKCAIPSSSWTTARVPRRRRRPTRLSQHLWTPSVCFTFNGPIEKSLIRKVCPTKETTRDKLVFWNKWNVGWERGNIRRRRFFIRFLRSVEQKTCAVSSWVRCPWRDEDTMEGKLRDCSSLVALTLEVLQRSTALSVLLYFITQHTRRDGWCGLISTMEWNSRCVTVLSVSIVGSDWNWPTGIEGASWK